MDIRGLSEGCYSPVNIGNWWAGMLKFGGSQVGPGNVSASPTPIFWRRLPFPPDGDPLMKRGASAP
jgi:hypothetical protein